MYYQFMDRYSGGDQKVGYDYIYIQADSEAQACKIFYNRFGVSPYAVACSCCGPNFFICDVEDFEVGSQKSSIVID